MKAAQQSDLVRLHKIDQEDLQLCHSACEVYCFETRKQPDHTTYSMTTRHKHFIITGIHSAHVHCTSSEMMTALRKPG